MAKIGNSSPHFPIAKALAEAMGEPVGDAQFLDVRIRPAKNEHISEQRSGFHWLLGRWLKMDPRITVDLLTLKAQLQMACFGVVRRVGLHGQEDLIPARTTTRVWDHDLRRYVQEELPKDGYTRLIEFTYASAAEDGVILPELEKEHAESS